MRVANLPSDFRELCDKARREQKRVGLVPTMGALHEGHFSLVEEAKRQADFVAATIFVNPLQFGAGEDLARYPKTLEQDLDACRSLGVDVAFVPDTPAMYPDGFQSAVTVSELTSPLEGEHRPEHFAGVTTVVTKLFNLTGPSVAVFGRKDYQQWKVLERMVHDLDMPIEVVGCPIVREPDGLALSSRNRYLSDGDRRRALGIVAGLRSAVDAWESGQRDPAELRSLALGPVEERFDRIDYVAAANPDTLTEPKGPTNRLLIAVAAHLGTTRLIDNIVLGEEPQP